MTLVWASGVVLDSAGSSNRIPLSRDGISCHINFSITRVDTGHHFSTSLVTNDQITSTRVDFIDPP
jgi:hypothetical protein